MFFFNDFLWTQVRIKEKVVINPRNQPTSPSNNQSTNTSSTGTTIITATIQYRACSGNVILYISNSPCNSYDNSVTGTSVNGYGDPSGIAKLTVRAYDYGSYSFGITSNLYCPNDPAGISECGWSSNCIWGFTISDSKGWSNTIPGMGPNPVGGSYFNSTSNVCNDVQPQQLDTNSFEVYKQGDLFFDVSLPSPIVVDNCSYNLREGTIRFGLTIPLWFVNMDKRVPYYDALQDIRDVNKDPEICLDNTNPANKRWLFRFNTKVRIPIFSSLCPPIGFTNLGGNSTVWQTTITSCKIYKKAHKAMKYWLKGNYISGGLPPDSLYFDSMIMAHEYTHLENLKIAIQDSMNKAYKDAFNNRPSLLLFPCAKNALDSYPKQGENIQIAYGNATKDKGYSEKEKLAKEIATDEDPRTKDRRQIIFDQFIAWGQSKGWVDQNGNIICP